MTRPARRPPTPPSRAALIALVAGLAVVAFGYAFTRAGADTPDASWRALELDVDGLDCAFWCSVRVGDAIDALPGAAVEAVDAAAGRVHVRYDPARRAVDEIVRAVESRGFAVAPVESAR